MMDTKSSAAHPIYIVLGSGGHTAEMCNIKRALIQYSEPEIQRQYQRSCCFLLAATDNVSRLKMLDCISEENATECNEAFVTRFIQIPRSREVGQSWLTTIVTTLWALLFSFWLVWRDRPQLLLCNGPGTCVPLCVAAFWWRLLGRLPRNSRIVFVESYCRVRTMSLSGRLLRPIVDLLVVQWQPLAQKYKHYANVKYFGRLM